VGRKAKPYVRRQWYVTEADGKGMHQLCLVSEGITPRLPEHPRQAVEGPAFSQRFGRLRKVARGEVAVLVLDVAPEAVVKTDMDFGSELTRGGDEHGVRRRWAGEITVTSHLKPWHGTELNVSAPQEFLVLLSGRGRENGIRRSDQVGGATRS
jgi:hypothetical protein